MHCCLTCFSGHLIMLECRGGVAFVRTQGHSYHPGMHGLTSFWPLRTLWLPSVAMGASMVSMLAHACPGHVRLVEGR